jgi:predicted nucleic acid-binding protein
LLTDLLAKGHDLAVAPQTLAEFIHIVTDSKRMPHPLSMSEAVHRATHWWQAAEVVRVFPTGEIATDFLSWLQVHGLGRKRLIDTLLAATFHRASIRHIITNNERDYRAFGVFEMVGYRE